MPRENNQNSCFSDPLPLQYFFNNPKFSDVILTVGDGKNAEDFYASRVILAAWSSPLAKLLAGPFREGNQSKIQLNEIDPNIFRIILQFLYQCSDAQLTQHNICDVIRTVDQLCMERLLHHCEEYLIHELNQLQTYWMHDPPSECIKECEIIGQEDLMSKDTALHDNPSVPDVEPQKVANQGTVNQYPSAIESLEIKKSNDQKEYLLNLLLDAFYLSLGISSLTRLRSTCMSLAASSVSLSCMVHQSCCQWTWSRVQLSSVTAGSGNLAGTYIILRLPMHVLGELLAMDGLQVPEELLLLSVWKYVMFHGSNLSNCYIRDCFHRGPSIKTRGPLSELDLCDQAIDQDQYTDSIINGTPSTVAPRTPDSTRKSGESAFNLIPVSPLNSGAPILGSISDVKELDSLDGKKRRAVCTPKHRSAKRRCDPTVHQEVFKPECGKSLEICNDSSLNSQRLIPTDTSTISFFELCHLLDLPHNFFLSLFSDTQLPLLEVKATVELCTTILLFHKLESRLRYVLICPERLSTLEIPLMDSNLVKQAILWHLNPRRYSVGRSINVPEDVNSDEDSDVDRNARVEQLKKRILKLRKKGSFPKIRDAALRFCSLSGYSSCPQRISSQSCSPRQIVPFQWKINHSRMELRGANESQVVVCGDLQAPPADWVPAISRCKYRYGVHEFFFRLDVSGFNNIIIGITCAGLGRGEEEEELTVCCHSNGKSRSLVLYHSDEREGVNSNRVFVEGTEPADGDIIYMRLDLGACPGRLQFFAIRRKPHYLYPLGNTELVSEQLNSFPPDRFKTDEHPYTCPSRIPLPLTQLNRADFPTVAMDNIGRSAMSDGIRSTLESSKGSTIIAARRGPVDTCWHRCQPRCDDDSMESDGGESIYRNAKRDSIFVRSPILSSNRILQKVEEWSNCGNILLEQHTVSKQQPQHQYFYEIWSLGRFTNLLTDSSYPRCFPDTHPLRHSENDYAIQQAGLSWRPFIDMRDPNDSITLLPYQHDVAPFIPITF